jgi:hypothetical protein
MAVIMVEPEVVAGGENIDWQVKPKVRVEQVEFGRNVTSKEDVRDREHENATFARGSEVGAS